MKGSNIEGGKKISFFCDPQRQSMRASFNIRIIQRGGHLENQMCCSGDLG